MLNNQEKILFKKKSSKNRMMKFIRTKQLEDYK